MHTVYSSVGLWLTIGTPCSGFFSLPSPPRVLLWWIIVVVGSWVAVVAAGVVFNTYCGVGDAGPFSHVFLKGGGAQQLELQSHWLIVKGLVINHDVHVVDWADEIWWERKSMGTNSKPYPSVVVVQ